MAKVITATAKRPGQLPDRTWIAEGETFQIEEKLFSARWMTKVEEPKKAPPKSKAKAEG